MISQHRTARFDVSARYGSARSQTQRRKMSCHDEHVFASAVISSRAKLFLSIFPKPYSRGSKAGLHAVLLQNRILTHREGAELTERTAVHDWQGRRSPLITNPTWQHRPYNAQPVARRVPIHDLLPCKAETGGSPPKDVPPRLQASTSRPPGSRPAHASHLR